jgi:WD40 repeat protein
MEGHEQVVRAIVFSADGLLLASGDGGGQIVIWDNNSLLSSFLLDPPRAVRQMEFNAFRGQSTVLAVIDDTGTASFWGIVEASE